MIFFHESTSHTLYDNTQTHIHAQHIGTEPEVFASPDAGLQNRKRGRGTIEETSMAIARVRRPQKERGIEGAKST